LLFFRISEHTDFVGEWRPFGAETGGFAVLLVLFAAAALAVILARPVSPFDAARVFVLGVLAFSASRNGVVAAIALGPLMVRFFGPLLARLPRAASFGATGRCLMVPGGLAAQHARDHTLFRLGLNHLLLPVEATAFLERHGLRGPLFNDYNFGGYLLWKA